MKWIRCLVDHFFERSRRWTCVRRALHFELNFCHQQSLWMMAFVTNIHSLFEKPYSGAHWNSFRIPSKAQKTFVMSLKLFSGCNGTPISTSPKIGNYNFCLWKVHSIPLKSSNKNHKKKIQRFQMWMNTVREYCNVNCNNRSLFLKLKMVIFNGLIAISQDVFKK